MAHVAWYKRFQARLLAHGYAPYERAVEPWKRRLFGTLTGKVLEIGAGSGANLGFLQPSVHYVGLEPNRFAREFLVHRLAERGLGGEVVGGNAESLPFSDEAFDAVFCSLVFCTVHDVPRALSEVRRVLRPGGRFAFVEHVVAPRGAGLRVLQHLVKPVWYVLGDGCRPDRDTAGAIGAAGFSAVDVDDVRFPVPIVGPHLIGSAWR